MFRVLTQAVLHTVDFLCYIFFFAGFVMTAKSDGFTKERLRLIGVNSARAVWSKLRFDAGAVLDKFELLCEYWA